MEVLKLTTKIDESGCLNLNIPTELVDTEVDVVVVVNPVKLSDKPESKYYFSDLVGQLSWEGDAVEQQRALRNEW